MKAFLSFLSASLLFIGTASADWVIESKIESPQLNSNTTTKIKGDKVRVDIPEGPAGAMSSIIDTTSGETTQLLHSQKMAMKTSAAQLKQMMGNKPAAGPKAPIKATGQKEKVGGYDCEIYTWTDGTTSSRFWVTKDHPQAAALKALEKQMRSGIFADMQMGADTSTLPGVVVKTEATVQGQKVITTVVSVKEQPVEASEFDVPADYKSLAMPGQPAGK